jgi:hypothetical protein
MQFPNTSINVVLILLDNILRYVYSVATLETLPTTVAFAALIQDAVSSHTEFYSLADGSAASVATGRARWATSAKSRAPQDLRFSMDIDGATTLHLLRDVYTIGQCTLGALLLPAATKDVTILVRAMVHVWLSQNLTATWEDTLQPVAEAMNHDATTSLVAHKGVAPGTYSGVRKRRPHQKKGKRHA